MELIKIDFSSWYKLTIEINWILLAIIIIAICVLIFAIRKDLIVFPSKHITVENIKLGLGNSSIDLKYNSKDREVAYKIWIELNTRKIGLEYDEENDVIIEIYNSWYESFGTIRELLKDLPAEQIRKSSELVQLVMNVLNEELRPNLTKWQARYRKWYEEAVQSDENKNLSPQEIQKKYPQYKEIVVDIKTTNKHITAMQALLKKVAFGKKY